MKFCWLFTNLIQTTERVTRGDVFMVHSAVCLRAVCFQEIFQHYASQRKRTEVEQQGLEALMSVKTNKKLVQQKYQAATGKVITLKDLSNYNRNVKESVSSNDISDVVSFLKASGATTVEVIVDDEQNFQGLFVEDNQMKTVYNDFPSRSYYG